MFDPRTRYADGRLPQARRLIPGSLLASPHAAALAAHGHWGVTVSALEQHLADGEALGALILWAGSLPRRLRRLAHPVRPRTDEHARR